MRKLTILFALLTLSAGLWANSITYTATSALQISSNPFDLPVVNHTWSSDTKQGMITFDGDVTRIEMAAFQECTMLTSITIPNTITVIRMWAFHGCSKLTSVTFEGNACQNNLVGETVFEGVGTAQKPTTLILPEDWNYDAAPSNSSTAWYGGYFNSNLYSTDGATDKQAALNAITEAMGEYSESAYLQSLVAEYVTNINNATNKPEVNSIKQAAIEKLTPIVAVYPSIFNEGDAAGYARGKNDGINEGKAEAKAALPTDPEGTAGHTVTITKGDKTLILVNPDKVTYGKQE